VKQISGLKMEAVSSSEMLDHVTTAWHTNPQEDQHLNTIVLFCSTTLECSF